jgi:mono/diheme cytochrome c family protein
MMRKALLIVGSVLVIIIAGGAVFVASRQNLKFDAPYPDIAATSDSSIVERGHYIVRNVAPCASCHGDPAQRKAYANGEDTPLIGGFVFDIPPGQFYTRNLTPDAETGLGNVPDRAIARALRYGVGHDGRALLPFMEMQGLSDDDLLAVVSYLRTQPPVRNTVPPHRVTLLGHVPGSPMAWQAFSRMTEDDLRAIYRYLKSVPAVKRDVGPPVVNVGKA